MPDSALRVLFLPLYPETMPSSRLRVYQYLPHLRRWGIEGTVLPALSEPWFSRFYYSPSKWVHFIQYSTEVFRNFWRISQGQKYDILFIQKGVLSTNLQGFDRLVEKANPRLVFDLDDSVYGRNLVEFRWPFLQKLQDSEQTAKISSLSRAVVAGNSYLKERALRYNRNVYLIPTPVDTNRFAPRQERPEGVRGEVVIGWMGIAGTLGWVRSLEEVFRELARRYPIRIKLITRVGREIFDLPQTRFDIVQWSYETEVQEMEEIDIGVAPLPDMEWSKGKCSLKLLQYMAMGLPSVSSRVGMNCEVVEEGVDGFLATDPDEWIQKLSRLIEDPLLRERMGRKAREKVVRYYSLDHTAPLLAEVLKNGSCENLLSLP